MKIEDVVNVDRLVRDRQSQEKKIQANAQSIEQLTGLHVMLCTLVDELAEQVQKNEVKG